MRSPFGGFFYSVVCIVINPIQVAYNTALLVAVSENDVDTVTGLLAAGADVNAQDRDGCTSLMLAAQNHFTVLYKYLLSHGADRTVIDGFGHTVDDYLPVAI